MSLHMHKGKSFTYVYAKYYKKVFKYFMIENEKKLRTSLAKINYDIIGLIEYLIILQLTIST